MDDVTTLMIGVGVALVVVIVGMLLAGWRAGRKPKSPTPETSPTVRRSVWVGNPPPPDPHFTDRETQIADLKRYLLSDNREAMIIGMRGVGKSTLAYQVAAELASDYPVQLLIDLQSLETPRTTTEALTYAIQSIVSMLGGEVRMQNLPSSEKELSGVYYHLLTESNQPILIVLEDPLSLEQVNLFRVPRLCGLLITTRTRLAYKRRVDLLELTPHDSVALLRKLAADTPDADATTIATLCGHLPVALSLAGSTLVSGDWPDAAAYARDLKGELKKQKKAGHGSVRERVDEVLALSYRLLDEEHTQCLHALAVFPAPFSEVAALWMARRRTAIAPDAGATPTTPKADLEQRIRESYQIIRESEGEASLSSRPKEKALLQGDIHEHQTRITSDLDAYFRVCQQQGSTPAEDIAAIAAAMGHPQPAPEETEATPPPPQPTDDPDNDDDMVLLRNLVRLSLVLHDRQNGFYRLHDLVRDFLFWRSGAEARAAAEQHYVAYVLEVARAIGLLYPKGGELQIAVLQRFDAELQHFTTVFEWVAGNDPDHPHDSETVATLVYRLGDVLPIRFPPSEQLRWFAAWRAAARAQADQRSETVALVRLGDASRSAGAYPNAITYYQQALALAREQAHQQLETSILSALGKTYRAAGDYQQAREHLERVRQREAQAGVVSEDTLLSLGQLAHELGEPQQAQAYLEQALQRVREEGNQVAEAIALNELGNVMYRQEAFEQAIKHYQAALTIAQQLGDLHLAANLHGNLGKTYRQQGQRDQALQHLQRALQMAQHGGYRQIQAHTLAHLGAFYHGMGQPDQALTHYEQALDLYKAMGHQRREAGTSYNLAHLYLAQRSYGDILEAFKHMRRAVELARRLDPPHPFDLAQAEEVLTRLRQQVGAGDGMES